MSVLTYVYPVNALAYLIMNFANRSFQKMWGSEMTKEIFAFSLILVDEWGKKWISDNQIINHFAPKMEKIISWVEKWAQIISIGCNVKE